MKTFFIFFFTCLTLIASGQKFALVDRDLKKPILFTDSVTVTQVSKNYFPIKVSDLDTLFANINYLKTQLGDIQRSKFKSYKLRSGSTIIQINTVTHAYGDAYDISLTTSANNINAEYLISGNKALNKKAIKNLNAFTKFIKEDKDLVIIEFKEFHAEPIDVTVYIPYK